MNKKAKSILRSSIDLLLDIGVDSATMDKIAISGKTSKATIYKYFTDKETLYYEMVKYLLEDTSSLLQKVQLKHCHLIVKIKEFIEIVSQFTDSGYYGLCISIEMGNVEVKKIFKLYQETYQTTLKTLIRQGFEQELIKPELSEEMVLSYIDMGIQYYQINDLYRYRMNHDHQFQNSFMQFLLGNIFINEITKEDLV